MKSLVISVVSVVAGLLLAGGIASAGGWKIVGNGDTVLAPNAGAMCKMSHGNFACGSTRGNWQVGISKHIVAIGHNGSIIWHRSF